jgi:hypothetical protein
MPHRDNGEEAAFLRGLDPYGRVCFSEPVAFTSVEDLAELAHAGLDRAETVEVWRAAECLLRFRRTRRSCASYGDASLPAAQ